MIIERHSVSWERVPALPPPAPATPTAPRSTAPTYGTSTSPRPTMEALTGLRLTLPQMIPSSRVPSVCKAQPAPADVISSTLTISRWMHKGADCLDTPTVAPTVATPSPGNQAPLTEPSLVNRAGADYL